MIEQYFERGSAYEKHPDERNDTQTVISSLLCWGAVTSVWVSDIWYAAGLEWILKYILCDGILVLYVCSIDGSSVYLSIKFVIRRCR